MDAATLTTLLTIHQGLPQQGPGSGDSTRRALAACDDLPGAPLVLDAGCGSGRQTLALARALPGAHITAIDMLPAFIAELTERAQAAGLGGRITARIGDMTAPPIAPGSLDLVWSEAAAYAIGIETALACWAPLLKPGGWLGLSDLVWTTDSPPAEAADFWAEEYPAMADEAALRARVQAAGFEIAAQFRLPPSDWAAYYDPLEERLPSLAGRFAGDHAALAILDATRREIALTRAHGDSFGYHFVVARKII